MLSGLYRTLVLFSHWSTGNWGFCQTTTCKGLAIKEDLTHILADCGALRETRLRLQNFTSEYCKDLTFLIPLVAVLNSPSNPTYCQFLVDCSVLPQVISATQHHGSQVTHHLFRITRTWCFSLHKARLQILNRWTRFYWHQYLVWFQTQPN